MVMRKIAQEKICAAVVLEDDAIIFGDLGRVCNAALRDVKFDVLLLGYSKVNAYDLGKRHLTEPMQPIASCFGRKLGFAYRERRTGTVGYVVTEAGAKKILAIQGDVITVADDWPYFKRKNLDIAHIYPAVVLEDTFSTASAIAADRQEMEGKHVPTLATFRAIVRLARGVIWSMILSIRSKKLMVQYSLRRKE